MKIFISLWLFASIRVSREDGNQSPDSTQATLANLIPADLAQRGVETGGVDKLMMIPNVERFVQETLPKLEIQRLSRYLGNGYFGVIFEVDLKPKNTQVSNPSSNNMPAANTQATSKKTRVSNKRTVSKPPAKAKVSKIMSKVTSRVSKGDQAPLNAEQQEPIEPQKGVLKIAPDWIDFARAPDDFCNYEEDFDYLQDKMIYSQMEEYKSYPMRPNIEDRVNNIRTAISGLSGESALKEPLSGLTSKLDGIMDKGQALPEEEAKSKEQLTAKELEAIAGIIEDVDSLALGSLESLASNEDDLKVLRKIIHNAYYVKLVLGQEYQMNEKERSILTRVQANISQLPCTRCSAYQKQNDLMAEARNIAGYSVILKAMPQYRVVCFAVMAMAEQDLNTPIEFLPDAYSNVKPEDPLFKEKTNDRFQKLMEIIKDILEGVFDMHLRESYLHGDIKADNMLLYEEDGKLKVKINDFDNVKKVSKADLFDFQLKKEGLDSISVDLSSEAQRLIWMMEELFTLNQSEIGVHTIDDTELRVDGHEGLTETLPIRELIIRHFQYLQSKVPGVIITKNWLTGEVTTRPKETAHPESLLI